MTSYKRFMQWNWLASGDLNDSVRKIERGGNTFTSAVQSSAVIRFAEVLSECDGH